MVILTKFKVVYRPSPY